MATSVESSGLSINEQAIVEAVRKIAARECEGLPEDFKNAIIRDAIECIADEQTHVLSKININQVIGKRIDRLAVVAEEQGIEL